MFENLYKPERIHFKKRQVVLFSMHTPSKGALEEFQRIKESMDGGLGDCFIAYDNREGGSIDPAILREPHWLFSEQNLSALGYNDQSAKSLIPGKNHWPVISFSRENAYDYYWNIEYDVRFIGNWKILFSHFTKANDDFITAHVQTYQENPNWFYWSTLSHPDISIDRKDCLRSFNPIYRISRSGLRYIDQMQQQEWRGHHEVLLPTLLSRENFKLRDFGGTGQFVRFGEKNRFYKDGAFRYRPPVESFQGYENKLVHPVK